MNFHFPVKILPAFSLAILMVMSSEASAQPGSQLSQVEEGGSPQAVARVQVYKKWIGAAGDEADVEVALNCFDGRAFPVRVINKGVQASWEVDGLPPEGHFCSIREKERDTFIADETDCKNLLMVPGQETECTMVNTKLVKRIDMLNRYGLVIMIAVMMGAGLAATRKFGPV